MSKNDFFIGWSPDMPTPDRRMFLGAGLALLGGAGMAGYALSKRQNAPGPGSWAMGEVREFRGYATAEPYAMLRLGTPADTPEFALLGCQGKCGVSARIGALSGKPVRRQRLAYPTRQAQDDRRYRRDGLDPRRSRWRGVYGGLSPDHAVKRGHVAR